MEPRPADPPPWPPAVRPDAQPPVSVPRPAPPPVPGPRPRFSWTRFTRSPRGAAGLVIAAAALLLWPFSGWSWIPWLAGAGAVVLLRLLRLDKVLRNWDLHLAGLVVVAGLMLSTGPWDWALAASIGVLLAGLAQLPWWRLAAVGAVMCVASGIGFAVTRIQEEQVQAEQAQQVNEEDFALYGERRPERVLPALLEGIVQGDVPAVCGLLDDRAEQDFVRASEAADCRAAVERFRAAAGPQLRFDDLDASTVQVGASWLTDGCRTAWAEQPLGGPALGRIDVRQSPPPGPTYFVAAFLPCEAR